MGIHGGEQRIENPPTAECRCMQGWGSGCPWTSPRWGAWSGSFRWVRDLWEVSRDVLKDMRPTLGATQRAQAGVLKLLSGARLPSPCSALVESWCSRHIMNSALHTLFSPLFGGKFIGGKNSQCAVVRLTEGFKKKTVSGSFHEKEEVPLQTQMEGVGSR